jgi:hypothetical protein
MPTPVTTRQALEIEVLAQNAAGETIDWQQGTVHVSTTDPAAIVTPQDIVLNKGIGIGHIAFETLGTQTVTVSTGGLRPASSMVSVTAAPPLAITSGILPGGVVGQAYSPQILPVCVLLDDVHDCVEYQPQFVNFFPLTLTGGVLPNAGFGESWSWAAQSGSSLPPGLSLQPLPVPTVCYCWEIAGTPTQAGTYRVVLTATDTGSPPASVTAAYTVVVTAAPSSPALDVVPGPQGATVNQSYSYDFSASGVAPITFAETGALPPGMTLSSGGHLGGTPTSTGSFPISVTATDGLGATVTLAFTVQVFQRGFASSGSLTTARLAHTATLMRNGQILVMGGQGVTATTPIPSIPGELYDTSTQTVAGLTATDVNPRWNHTATLLCDLTHAACDNSPVLLAGGLANPSAILYGPVSNTYSGVAGGTNFVHVSGTATLLPDGRVLVAGGNTPGADIFDRTLVNPSYGTTGSFVPPPLLMMSTQRTRHTATLLSSGKVLITGGYGQAAGFLEPGQILASAEIYDPIAGTFAPAVNLVQARAGHTATLLPDGRVLLAGGYNGTGPLASAEIYDPSSGSFSLTGRMVTPRAGHTAVLLSTGMVLIAGGEYFTAILPHAELFDPASGTFANTGGLQAPRILHSLTAFGAVGQAQAIGGMSAIGGPALQTTEVYQ